MFKKYLKHGIMFYYYMSSKIEKVIVVVKKDLLANAIPNNLITNINITNISKNMDSYNKAAFTCLQTKGIDCAVKHMFTDQDTGKTLSYSEMRERYG